MLKKINLGNGSDPFYHYEGYTLIYRFSRHSDLSGFCVDGCELKFPNGESQYFSLPEEYYGDEKLLDEIAEKINEQMFSETNTKFGKRAQKPMEVSVAKAIDALEFAGFKMFKMLKVGHFEQNEVDSFERSVKWVNQSAQKLRNFLQSSNLSVKGDN